MIKNIKQNEHDAFKQSFLTWAKEQIAKNPRYIDLKKLLESMETEARKRLGKHRTVLPFAAFIDERGDVTLIVSDEMLTFDKLVGKLRGLAKEGVIRAVCICKIVECDSGQEEAPKQFIELLLEHRDSRLLRGRRRGLLKGIPVLESLPAARYGKGVPALIFQDDL